MKFNFRSKKFFNTDSNHRLISLLMKNLIICIFVAFSTITNAQTKSIKKSPPLKAASPGSAGMSTERLARIDRMCEEAVSEGDIPGVVALVARHGKIVYWKAFGKADNQTGRASRTDDIFRIASQSKAVTSTAVMMLWEEGKFQLDDPVSKYIPEFKNPQVLKSFQYSDTTYTTVDASCEITIRHLLTHTSGIGYGPVLYAGAEMIRLLQNDKIDVQEARINSRNSTFHYRLKSEWPEN